MKRSEICLSLVSLAAVLLTISGVGAVQAQDATANAVRVMPPAGPGMVSTDLQRRIPAPDDSAMGPVRATSVPTGYGPADLQDAYKIPIELGAGRTVAIVAAYDDPTIEQDIAVYRAQFGLPPCTVASGCLRKIDQNGGTNLPGVSPAGDDWAPIWALSAEMVSAACPNCNILLVEAVDDVSFGLFIAVNAAAAQPDVAAIEVLAGGPSDGKDQTYDSEYFDHPGIAMVTPAGNNGNYGSVPYYPPSSPYVTAVGGTTLVRDGSTRGWSETAWSGSGSGCSRIEPKPAFQTNTACAKRTIGDVAAVADPNTGVAVYDSRGSGGWAVYGGTEVAASLVAAIYALAAPAGPNDYPVSYPYASPSALFDVTSGRNGSCSGLLCAAGPGYDGPTGLGTPNGIAAFQPPGAAADFSLSLSPTAASVVAGGSASATVATATALGSAQSLTLATGPLPAGVTASFSPAAIDSGNSSTLTFTTTPAAAPGTADISVTASNGTTIHDATFTLTVVAPPPSVSIGVAPPSIVVGSSATLSWSSTNATVCTASGAWTGTVATTGTQAVSPAATGTFVYSLSCSGAGGSTSGSATLTVTPPPPPTVSLTATPAVVRILETSRLDWTTSGAVACRASGEWRGSKPLDGFHLVLPLIPGVHTYGLTCSGPGGTTTATATVTVRLRIRRAADTSKSQAPAPGSPERAADAIDPREGRGPGMP